jgi:hypothetical protein
LTRFAWGKFTGYCAISRLRVHSAEQYGLAVSAYQVVMIKTIDVP